MNTAARVQSINAWRPDAEPIPETNTPSTASLIEMYAPDTPPRPGAIVTDHMDVYAGWHYHDMHQLSYAFEGAMQVDTAEGRHLVPHQLAVWIPAGLPHRLSIRRVRSGSIFFPAEMIGEPGTRIRTIAASSLMKEMIREAMRWHLSDAETPLRKSYFETMAGLCAEWIQREADLFLPIIKSHRLRRVFEYTAAHYDANLPEICQEIGISERSLRRHLKSETGLSWDAYRQRMRLLRAISLLTETELSIIEVASQCGFESPSAFAKVFRAAMNESPSNYRQRVRSA